MTKEYKIGSVIQYRSAGELRTVLVDEKSDDIKNGRPGFAGEIVESKMTVWGYDSQIVAVVSV